MIDVLVLDHLSLGRRCRILRLAKGLRQDQVAHLAGVSPGRISAFERGLFVNREARRRILAALDISDDPETAH